MRKLTNAEITVMPAGRDLDALIAELFLEYAVRGDYVIFPDGDHSYLVPDLGGHWSPSQDPHTALEVWKKLVEKERFPTMHEGPDETGEIMVFLSITNPVIDLVADEFPVGICRLALLSLLEAEG